MFPGGRALSVHLAARPPALHGDEPARPDPDGPRDARAPAPPSRGRAVRVESPRTTGSRAMGPRGLGRRLGTAASRQVRGPRAEQISMALAVEQADAAATLRGRRPAGRCSAIRAAASSRCSSGCGTRSSRGRAGADRPPGEVDRARRRRRLRGRPGARRTRSARARPARVRPGGERERYDAVIATVPSDVFAAGRARTAARARPAVRRRRRRRPVPDRALRAARARSPLRPLLLDQHRRRRLPFIGLIEQTNLIGPEHYGGRRFLYVANYSRRRPAARARHRRAARRLRAGAAPGQPGVRPLLGPQPLGLPRARRAAGRDPRLPRADAAAADTGPGPRARQHDPDLPRGPRHQLQRPAGRAGARLRRPSS